MEKRNRKIWVEERFTKKKSKRKRDEKIGWEKTKEGKQNKKQIRTKTN